jgi:tetratricopeptide (TPR) repeat protein
LKLPHRAQFGDALRLAGRIDRMPRREVETHRLRTSREARPCRGPDSARAPGPAHERSRGAILASCAAAAAAPSPRQHDFEDHAMSLQVIRLLHLVLLVSFAGLVRGADTAPSLPDNDPLASARAQIAAKNWAAAIDELKRVNAATSADWNNLMGYAHRKSKAPDYAAAEKYYDEALRIEPRHRGALEYSGELYLIKGDLAKAEQRLAALDKACFLPCEEYSDLKNAVARYKAAGNKYVAAP